MLTSLPRNDLFKLEAGEMVCIAQVLPSETGLLTCCAWVCYKKCSNSWIEVTHLHTFVFNLWVNTSITMYNINTLIKQSDTVITVD